MASTTAPTTGTLLARLSRSSDPQPAPVVPALVALVPRPPLLLRLLFIAAMGMVLAVCAGIVVVGVLGLDLVGHIRVREAEIRAVPEVPIPSQEVLLDRDRLGAAMANHPAEAGRFLAARARAMAAGGDPATAFTAWQEAQMAGGLLPGDLIDYAAQLLAARRLADAESTLQQLPWKTLAAGDRTRAVDLLGRCQLMRWSAPAR